MALVELDELKTYLRLDAADISEDTLLLLFLDNAENFLRCSIEDYDTKINNDMFENQAKLLILTLVQDMYDNRQLTTKDNEKYKLLVQSFLTQMKYTTYE